MMDNKALEEKWIAKWEEAKLFEATPDKRPKFFGTFPYPYVNGYSHLGHFFSIMRLEAFARYKRMKGFNVLFPQGWHCTGSPIENAAQRIREKEEKQVKIMKDMGFSPAEIKKFEDPKYWVEYFPKEYEKDFKSAGLSIDFRREFITTSLNPHYDRFIRWQFRKLQEKNYVVKGKHPVVWCTKDNSPVGDHARVEGEGETPQEFTLLKFKLEKEFLIAATLRPETVYGQTNLWVDPEYDYIKAKVNDETWIGSEPFFKKLKEQDKEVKETGKVKGKDLIGKFVIAPAIEKEVIILPSFFCSPDKGTGIVTSVPSDAPDDYIGLRDLQEDEALCKKYDIDYKKIKQIKPIPIINTKELGDMPAVKLCTELKIKNQHEREKLEKAKKIVYKAGFYAGVMTANSGKYKGMPVEKAKDAVKDDLIKNGKADIFYELTGKVVCRCLTPSIVKIVSDQWFLDYGDAKWKKLAHKCLDQMKVYPEKARVQFDYVIDWLKAWACTREFGLGTDLPWDENWVIESLSDSTIYMAYYTIAHKIKEIPIDEIDDTFFDYVFLGKGKSKVNIADDLRKEFDYWYPMDFRNSGKDLIQNHLSFSIFNHVAIFPEEKWPKGFGVNGHIQVDGQKMSKSLGNFLLIKDVIPEFGADASRIAVLYGGEGMDDVNFDRNFAKGLSSKLEQFHTFCIENYNKGSSEKKKIDEWFDSNINQLVKETTDAMEETFFRTALFKGFFDMQRILKWYLKRTSPNKQLINKFIESSLLMLAPFAPFICEETWEKMGKKDFISVSSWPEAGKINSDLNANEQMIEQLLSDIRNVMKLSKMEKPQKITIFVSDQWKYDFYKTAKKKSSETRNVGDILKEIMKTSLKQYGQEISKLLPKVLDKLPESVLSQDEEFNFLDESKIFLEQEFNSKIELIKADKSKEAKSKNAMPGKPAIIIS